MKARHLLLVIGMHRSGTSAITSGLQLLGVDLGHSLNPASPGVNDKGFFEDVDVLDLNIRLLNSMSHRWDSITPIPKLDLAAEPIARLAQEANAMLRTKFGTVTTFGIKDPRVSILLPFWQHVFSTLGIEPCYVVAVRNPLSVARSLARRDEMPLEMSMHLWQKYLLSCLDTALHSRSVFVNYDEFIDQPVQQLARIAGRLGLAFDPNATSVKQYVDDFLEDELRHTRYSDDELKHTAPSSVYETYRLLDSLASDRATSGNVSGRLDEFWAQWTDFSRSPLLMDQVHTRVTRLEQQLKVEREALSAANCLVQTRDGQVAASDALVRLRDEQISVLTTMLSVTQKQLYDSATLVEQRDTQLAQCETVVLERDKEIVGLRTLLKL